ncbi:MAG: hypothetical protein R2771_14985 [Saprospiraceae bacterium]
MVYKLAENKFMLIVNAANLDKDWNWVNSKNKFEATLKNDSDNMEYLLFKVQML